MRVIFLEDVPNVATAGEVKEVADGYGRNYLIPRKLAMLISPEAISQVEAKGKEEAKTQAEMGELASQLDGKEVTLKARKGSGERLYGSVTSADIATELNKLTGLDIDKRKIELAEPIHQLGSYEVAIKLGKDASANIKVTVVEETAAEEKAKAPKKETKKTAKKAEKAEEEKPKKKKTKKTTKEEKPAKKTTKKPAAKKVTKKATKTTKKPAKKKVEKKSEEEKA